MHLWLTSYIHFAKGGKFAFWWTDLQQVANDAKAVQRIFFILKKCGGLNHDKLKGNFLYPLFQSPQNGEIHQGFDFPFLQLWLYYGETVHCFSFPSSLIV